MRFSTENLAKLIKLVDNGVINRTVAKQVEGQLCSVIEEIVAANPKSVGDYHNGKEKANPAATRRIRKEILG